MLSVAIIAKDAAATIGACIRSVRRLTDDAVVVIDTSTSDTTAQICRKAGARIFFRSLDNFAAQKNFALAKTRHNWVLSLDADEAASPTLVNQILTALPQTSVAAYKFPRLNFIFGKAIYHTNWSPQSDTHVWLFNKTKCNWTGQVHEHVSVNGSIGTLSGPKYHYHYRTVEEFLSKTNLYTSLEVSSEKPSLTGLLFRPVWLRVLFQPAWKFFRHYFLFAGFLDGWHGLFLSYLMAVYGLSLTVKSWQKSKNIFP